MKCGTCAASHRDNIFRRLSGKRLIAAAGHVLANPQSDDDLANAFAILYRVKGDRGRFVQPAVDALQQRR